MYFTALQIYCCGEVHNRSALKCALHGTGKALQFATGDSEMLPSALSMTAENLPMLEGIL